MRLWVGTTIVLANGEVDLVITDLEMVAMEQVGVHPQRISLPKIVAGVKLRMVLNKLHVVLSGRMIVLLWEEDLMMVQVFGVKRDNQVDLQVRLEVGSCSL